ncbi:MAG TPA: hypothetical protein DCY03_02765, partial [Planctomycetaceae bacterium]|nr:hypothetical protein [Planctomycetaceae bacterium]
ASSALTGVLQPIDLIDLDNKQRFPITKERVVLGRNAGCDIRLDRPGISGEHCAFHYENTGWIVTDLKSKNGTE